MPVEYRDSEDQNLKKATAGSQYNERRVPPHPYAVKAVKETLQSPNSIWTRNDTISIHIRNASDSFFLFFS